jgi:hypothetical protein
MTCRGDNGMNKLKDVAKQITIHTVVVYAVALVSLLLSLLLVLIIPTFGQTSSVVGRFLEAPYWLPEIACGAITGWIIRKRFRVTNAAYGILVPLCLLLWNILTEGLRMRNYTPLIDVYFSANNGDTEGLYKLIFTAPLYTAVAYALGALASKMSLNAGSQSASISTS